MPLLDDPPRPLSRDPTPPSAPRLCKLLYDEDLVEEDAFLAWAEEKEHASEEERVFLRKAQRFIEWLRQEDDSDEEEDDEEDDDE